MTKFYIVDLLSEIQIELHFHFRVWLTAKMHRCRFVKAHRVKVQVPRDRSLSSRVWTLLRQPAPHFLFVPARSSQHLSCPSGLTKSKLLHRRSFFSRHVFPYFAFWPEFDFTSLPDEFIALLSKFHPLDVTASRADLSVSHRSQLQ